MDELVHLSEHSEHWASVFERERARLQAAVGVAAEQIEHIGSTSVPGLLAKPILDVQLGVPSFPPPQSMSRALVGLGYESLGEAGVSGRLYFRLRPEPKFNVHVVMLRGDHWFNNLAIRDFLRRSALAREQYANAKLAALRNGAMDLQAYSAAKAPFISALLAQARPGQNAGRAVHRGVAKASL